MAIKLNWPLKSYLLYVSLQVFEGYDALSYHK